MMSFLSRASWASLGLVALLMLGLLGPALAGGADWPQWRGPNRDAVAPDEQMKIAVWAAKGPLKVWESAPIPSGQNGGLASVVVAGDRVYLFGTPKLTDQLTTRTLSEGDLRAKFGWSPLWLPAALSKAVEEARLSPERAALKPNEVGEWIKKFDAAQLATPETKKFEQLVNDRLNRGPKALPLDLMDKLAALVGRPFKDQAALDKWLDDNQLKDDVRKAVAEAFPTTATRVEDVIYCLNASDGKAVWSKNYPGVGSAWGASCTPCVADGKAYVLGSHGTIYCLDAKDGKQIWLTETGPGDKNSSFLVLDGLVIGYSGQLVALDAATGAVVWTRPEVGAQHNSPVTWKKGGKTYLICNTQGAVACVDPQLAGKILWTAPGGSFCTAAVSGDNMAIFNGKHLLGYRLTVEKAEPLWQTEVGGGDRGASPLICKDRVYLAEAGRTVCVAMDSGKILWDGKTPTFEIGSAVLVGDKLLATGDKTLCLMSAGPEKFDLLAKAPMDPAPLTMPAIANGRLYIRLANSVACFDLSQSAPVEPAPATPVAK